MEKISIFLDINEDFKHEVIYTLRNVLFPYENIFKIEKDKKIWLKQSYKLLYCNENSSLLSNHNDLKNVIVIISEKSTIQYFHSKKTYNINSIIHVNKIVCLFPLNKKTSQIHKKIILMNFDFIAASYFFLSCWQEKYIKKFDKKGRIPLEETVQYKLNIYSKPIVNEYLNLFENLIQKTWGFKLLKKRFFNNKGFVINLSHDIDRYKWGFRTYLEKNYIAFLNKNLKENFFKIFINYFKQSSIFKKIYHIQFKNKIPTTYFFLTEYPQNNINHNKSLLKTLKGTIFEIAHHIDPRYLDELSLKKDISKFGKYKKWIVGERVHTLKFKIFNLLRLLNNSNYNYDSSLCFPEGIGYRTGFSYPHKIYDYENKKEFDTLIIPLNIMDTTLYDYKYMQNSDEESNILLNKFIQKNSKYGGVLTILFHHTFFWINSSGRIKFFDKFLSKLSKKGIGFYTLRDINIWYNGFKSNLVLDEN